MKMSEVFKLPMTAEYENDVGPYDESFWEWYDIIDSDGNVATKSKEYAEAAAHAINCHDELVASLHRVLGSKDWGNIAEHSDNCKCVYHESVATLHKAQGRNESE